MRGREKLYLALNLLLLTFCSIGIAQFAAFFPLYVGELGIRQELVAPIFSVFMVASLVMAMASGPLANRYSRLRVLTFAVGCVSTGSILFGLTPDLVDGEDRRVALFIVARLIQGLGRAGVDTMIFAMLRDRFPDDQAKVLGLAVASGAFAFTIGPPVGGLLFVALGFRVPFVLAGSMPPVVLALVLLAAPAKRGTTPTAKGAQDSSAQEEEERRITLRETAAWLWTVSSFRLFFPGLATAIAMAKWGIFDIGVTLWLTDEFRFPLEVASLVFSSCSIAFAFASPAAGVIADKLPQTHRWRTGMICVGLVLSGISNLSNWLYLGLPSWTVFVWVFHEGLVAPVMQAPALPDMHMSARVINRRLPTDTRIGQEQATNLITSVFQTLRVSGQAIGPLLGAPALATVGFRMVMTFTGMMFLLAGVLTAVCYMPRIKSDPEDDAAAAADAGKGAQMSTSGAPEQDDGEDERESLLRSSDS